MGALWAGLCTAFSLYSALPAPRVEWAPRNMRYALCFFPAIGVVIAAAEWGWLLLGQRLGLPQGLAALVAALLPVAVTGGIHMDGLMDAADAVASRASAEKKLAIMKDAHTGAFGVLACAVYLLLSWQLWQAVYAHPGGLALALAGFVLSRCMNPLSIVSIPPAKESGLVHLFATSAGKRAVVAVQAVVAVAVLLALCAVLSPPWGFAAGVLCVGLYWLHRRLCLRQFGGNTGDLAGRLLQQAELLLLAAAVIRGLL